MRVVVVSPHLDDAVISAFTAVRGATVVNVFDAAPPAGTLGLWDRLCGATDSAEQVTRRLAEDYAVLRTLDAERVSLSLLEAQYRDGWTPSVSDIADLLEPHVDGGAHVVAPLAGGPKPHPDHRLVRDAALALLEEGMIRKLDLYADVPYCVKQGGWPVSWGGDHPDPAWLGRALRDARYIGAWWTTKRVLLAQPTAQAKLEAMRGYATQYTALDRKLRVKGLLSNPAIYSYETYWNAEPPVR
jgi:LmbE family N-acetylglucosaminyl deacetylase